MLSVIIPTYNESKNIEILIKLIYKNLKDTNYEILVVDDNSPDKTAEIVKKINPKYHANVLVRYKNKGLSESVVDGIKNCKGDVVCVIDADLSHPPEVMPKMFEQINKGYDLVVASRLIKGGGTEDWPLKRQLNSYVGTLIAKPLTRINDPMSGYFMIRKNKINLDKLKPRGYKILLEIAVRSNIKNLTEVPFIFRDRTYGTSKLTASVSFKYLVQIIHLYLYKIAFWDN